MRWRAECVEIPSSHIEVRITNSNHQKLAQ